MNIKKSLTAVLAMSCLIFFSACGTSTNTSPPSSSPPEEKTDEIKVEDSTKTNEKGTIKDMSIDFASDFSNGVAWVTASTNEEGTSHEQFLIDKKGNILFSSSVLTDQNGNQFDFYGNTGVNLTNYYNDAALAYISYPDAKYNVTTADDCANTIINKNGEIIWSIEKEGWEEAKKFFPDVEITSVHGATNFTNGNTADLRTIPYRGYMAVEIEVDSFEYTGSYIGLLDAQGNWVVEPTTPCDSIAYSAFHNTEDYGFTSAWLFRYDTGELITIESDADPFDVEDDIATEIYFSKHNNLMWDIGNPDGFFDPSNKLVIDTEAMSAVGDDAVFEDGYAIIELENEQDSRYLTVIDTTGKQMFSPIKNTGHGNLSEGKFYWDEGQCYLDVNGEQIGDITGARGHDFSEGLAWLYINNEEWHCIDGEGNIVI